MGDTFSYHYEWVVTCGVCGFEHRSRMIVGVSPKRQRDEILADVIALHPGECGLGAMAITLEKVSDDAQEAPPQVT